MRFSDITSGRETHPSDVRSTRDICANVMWPSILPGGMV